MTRSFFVLICTTLVLSGCFGSKSDDTQTNTEAMTEQTVQQISEEMPEEFVDLGTGVSEEEIDAIVGEIFQAIESGVAPQDLSGSTQDSNTGDTQQTDNNTGNTQE